MSLSPNEVINKQLAQLFERTYRIRGYFTKPHSYRTFEGGREGSTHNFIWDPLKVHRSLKSSNVIKRVMHSIIRIQGRHLEFWRQGVTIDGSREREYVRWTRSSTGFALLMFSLISSITFIFWSISLSKCGTLLDVVPLDWLSSSAFPLSSYFWA